jgi:predicted phage gp36 major capsid-like protein
MHGISVSTVTASTAHREWATRPAPTASDAAATVTLQTASFSEVSGWAADPISLDPIRARASARLVLVDETQLALQRARYREGPYLFAPADPVLVGLNTLQHWLWNRIGSASADLAHANA